MSRLCWCNSLVVVCYVQREEKMLERETRCERSWRGGVDGGLSGNQEKWKKVKAGSAEAAAKHVVVYSRCGMWNVEANRVAVIVRIKVSSKVGVHTQGKDCRSGSRLSFRVQIAVQGLGGAISKINFSMGPSPIGMAGCVEARKPTG